MKNLDNIPKENHFKTPEGYFDKLNDEIISKSKANKNSKPASAFQIFKPYIYMAASLIVLVTLLKFTLNTFVDNDPIIKPDIEANSEINYDNILYTLYEDDIAFYEFLEEDNDIFANIEIEDQDIEDYLCSYYLEYELMYE